MPDNSKLHEWCKAQEQFLLRHLTCLRQGYMRVHVVEDSRFIDTTDDVVADFKRQLAELKRCANGYGS